MIINNSPSKIKININDDDIVIVDKDIDYKNNTRDEKLTRLCVGVMNKIGFDVYQRNAGDNYMIASIKVPAKQLGTLIEEVDIPRDIDHTTISDDYAIIEWGYWHVVAKGDSWVTEKPSLQNVLQDIQDVCNTFRNYY